MDYTSIHNVIIDRARTRTYDSKIYQNHHIIPRCEDINSVEMVPLTLKEHRLIHLLRYRMGLHLGNYRAYLLMRGITDIKTHLKISSLAGKLGGRKTKDSGSGIFSDSWDRSIETKSRHDSGVIVPYLKNNSEAASQLGKLSVMSGNGIHSYSWDRVIINKERWKNMTGEEYIYYSNINRQNSAKGGQKSKEMGTNFSSWDKDKHLNACSAGGKVSGKMLHWTNGTINKKSNDCPGIGWYRGRTSINVRKATNNKWYNNGIEHKLYENCPDGWILGMLKREKIMNNNLETKL